MLRRQSLIALGVAIVLGLVAVYIANIVFSAREKQVAVSPQGTTKVAVAAVPLDFGVDITADKVRFIDYPTASLPAGSFRSMAELLPAGKRRTALRPISTNEPILASKLTGEGQNATIAALLPDGMRAAAVRINDVSGVAGFIKPNDSVDVLVTRQTVGADGGEQVSDVLLQNIRVMALDQDAKSADGQPIIAKTATLEVSPLDAQKLALAQQVGSLSLVLRKPGAEQDNPTVETVSIEDLRYGLYGARYTRAAAPRVPVTRVLRAAPVRRAAPASPGSSVEVVRGTAASKYEVGGYGS
jgi:pilus assembly protein CpaB